MNKVVPKSLDSFLHKDLNEIGPIVLEILRNHPRGISFQDVKDKLCREKNIFLTDQELTDIIFDQQMEGHVYEQRFRFYKVNK